MAGFRQANVTLDAGAVCGCPGPTRWALTEGRDEQGPVRVARCTACGRVWVKAYREDGSSTPARERTA